MYNFILSLYLNSISNEIMVNLSYNIFYIIEMYVINNHYLRNKTVSEFKTPISFRF